MSEKGGITYRRRVKRSQPGFTLVELVIAVAIGAIILAGGVAILRAMLVSTQDSTDKELAMLEVQYVNFWIGEDTIQAQKVEVGNTSGPGFPLTLNWMDVLKGNTTVIYDVAYMDKPDQDLWRLSRVKTDDEGTGNLTVAEYLDPSLTICYQKQLGNGTPINVLVLNVASQVNRKSASGSYEVNPRFGNTTWFVTS